MNERHLFKRAIVIPIATFGAGAAGLLICAAGFILQINLLGHGPVTSTQQLGLLLMFAGPVFAGSMGMIALFLDKRTITRIFYSLQSLAALLIVLLFVGSIDFSRAQDARNHRLVQQRLAETQRFAQITEEAWKRERSGAREIIPVGCYKLRDSLIVDLIIVGPPEEVGIDSLAVDGASIVRFAWLRPTDGTEFPEVEWSPPPEGLPPEWKDDPRYEFMFKPPEPPEPQPVRRCAFLVRGFKDNFTIHSPYGDVVAPKPSELPMCFGLNPTFHE